jgi:hypothetical protein
MVAVALSADACGLLNDAQAVKQAKKRMSPLIVIEDMPCD